MPQRVRTWKEERDPEQPEWSFSGIAAAEWARPNLQRSKCFAARFEACGEQAFDRIDDLFIRYIHVGP